MLQMQILINQKTKKHRKLRSHGGDFGNKNFDIYIILTRFDMIKQCKIYIYVHIDLYIMARKEIEETLDCFYYPLKRDLEQCITNGTIMGKENLQKFETQAFRYATIHTEDSFKRCCKDPTKDNAIRMLFYFINSDIRDYEDILNNQQEYY